MRLLIWLGLALSLTIVPRGDGGIAAGAGISPEHHPWGGFSPGAWRQVRAVIETLDEKGLVSSTSITDTNTTLLEVDEGVVVLDREVTHEVAGKRYPREAETFREGYHGGLLVEGLTVKEGGSGQVVIDDRKIACQILQLELPGPTSKTVTDIYYCPTVAPYILKRQSVTSDPSGNNSRSETTTVVVALDMPCKVLAEIHNVAYVKTVLRHPNGTTITWAATSVKVPGGVVWHALKELDKTGRLIRRGTLELVDYGLEPEPERTGLFGRRRKGLFRKVPVRQP